MDRVEESMRRHKDKVFRTALAVLGCMADAEDVFQDVFLKLFQKQPEFESEEHEAAWLVRVTVNMCKSRLRSPWRRNTVPLSESHPAPTAGQHDLIEAVAALPAKYRTVIHLFYYEGYSIKEIALLTRQKESTVGNQLARARKNLKAYLEGEQR
jgi:RNA polymerase sigma-70 factor (ECF subfamily)